MSPEILISRDGQRFGPYSTDDLQRHIAEGTISPEDLAWVGGDQVEWQPLSELVDIESVKGAENPTPSPPSATTPKVGKPKASVGARVWRLIYKGTIVLAILFAALVTLLVMFSDKDEETTDFPPRENSEPSTGSVSRQPSKPSKPEPQRQAPQPATDANLLDIIETYDSNPLAGDQQFKGKSLRVTGIVKTVRENITGGGYYATIQPPIGQPLNSSKALAVETADQQVLASFAEGEVVTVAGTLIGLDRMDYPRITNAVVERKASSMEPIPGTVSDWTQDDQPLLDADHPVVRRAAELYNISFNNLIKAGHMDGYRGMSHVRIGEIVLLDQGPRHAFFRIGMFALGGGQGIINYAFVVVEGDVAGGFPEVAPEEYLIQSVAHCGSKPDAQQMMQLKRANGWTSEAGWPQ